jgi:membrane-associated phospholipid phosphatase
MSTKTLFKRFCISLVTTLVAVGVSVRWLDAPIALFFLRGSPHVAGLASAFGSSVLVTGDTSLMATLAIIRIVRGSLPRYAKALFVACCASLSAFAANDYILKLLFGRYGPYTFLGNPTAPIFNFFHGDLNCVFPSGHMVMSSAFAAVLFREYPRTRPIFTVLLGIAASTLLIGDWHFLSDIIAGIFVGGSVGFMAGELWYRHVRRITT